jgi:hypothetical protein
MNNDQSVCKSKQDVTPLSPQKIKLNEQNTSKRAISFTPENK